MKAFKIEIKNERADFLSYAASFILHAGIFISILLLINISNETAKINPHYVQITTEDLNSRTANSGLKEKIKKENLKHEKISEVKADDRENKVAGKEKEIRNNSAFYSFIKTNADTSGLDQIYNEPTLNVTIKYPAGWTYVDQDLKNRLDGVTFWSNIGNYSPPPYIHLEVKDKSLFSESRYKYKLKMRGYELYYNDPEKLEGQITQTIYIRTNTEEDFSLELIMEGEEAFKSFQPVFFGMIKTFKFGRSWF